MNRIARLIAIIRLKREIKRNLRARRAARLKKREAAMIGVSTECQRRGERARAMFGDQP